MYKPVWVKKKKKKAREVKEILDLVLPAYEGI